MRISSVRTGPLPSSIDAGLPGWVSRLGVPAWITDAEQRLRWMNPHAEHCLGLSAAACLRRPCYEVVAGRWLGADAGRAAIGGRLAPFCGSRCPLRSMVESSRDLEPLELCLLTPQRTEHWFHLLPILLRCRAGGGKDERLIVHCALPADREHRIEGYLAHVASRSPHSMSCDSLASLSFREREVLSRLAQDLTPGEVSERLNVSYVTVRNHIQHVLAKLGVHSTMEAVAMFLLCEPEGGARPRSERGPRRQ